MTSLGHSDLDIFPMVLGGNVFGWTADTAQSHQVLDGFVAGGGNLVDTADVYSAWVPGNSGGESERIVGEWLRTSGRRDDVLIATKAGMWSEHAGLAPSTVFEAADDSLRRLGTDRIDVFYAHVDDTDTPIEESAAAFEALIAAGKIRAVGLSNFSGARANEWITVARRNGWSVPVAFQPHYNLVHRAEYENDLAHVALEHDVAVLPYYGLASGFLTGKYRSASDAAGTAREGSISEYLTADGFALVDCLAQIADGHGAQIASVALAWLRSRAEVTAPIASARTVEQLPALMAAAALELSAEEIAALDSASTAFASN